MTKRALSALLAAGLTGVAACDGSPSDPADDLAMQVRQETAGFANTSDAAAAGYVEDDHCVTHPELGGMGYHWLNEPMIDPVYDPMQPEALLYRRDADGTPRLTGVEYIVIDAGQEHPDFDGHPFDVGGVPPLMEAGVPHWSLHVWLHEENPAGMFVPFNPNVTCP